MLYTFMVDSTFCSFATLSLCFHQQLFFSLTYEALSGKNDNFFIQQTEKLSEFKVFARQNKNIIT